MQKTTMTKAVALALATFAAGAAFAESSFTIYGNADVSVDSVHKTAGVPLIPVAPATQGKSSTVTRVSPSATSQTSFGLKGTEDIGAGYKAGFVLEGQLSHDTGALSQDGRIFGRQSYVGLTTPYGEVRLGRQYSPIFYSTALITGERFGATDLFTEGGSTNNLQVRQDNQISYWANVGGFTGALAYSPNAGSYSVVSAARGVSANSTTGGILGAAGAGAESVTNKQGRSVGMFGNYAFDANLNVTLGLHRNDFDGVTYVALNPATGAAMITGTRKLDRYQSVNLGAKYVFTGSGILLDAAYGEGKYSYDGTTDSLKLQSLAGGICVPVEQWTFSAQASQVKFTNFTKGKDTGLMLGAEYALSKRTAVFTRFVQVRDDEGSASSTGVSVAMVGGPDVVGVAFGLREVPLFAGAGINPGGKSTYVGAGIRHSF